MADPALLRALPERQPERQARPKLTLVAASRAPADPRALSPAVSTLLDFIRLTAALLVVAGHLGHPEFHTNLPNLQFLGDLAVPVFFVLSGFVIRHVTLAREHTLRDFLIDRASRMYSVMLPAMVLTIVLAVFCEHADPAYYAHYFTPIHDHPFQRVLLNLTFLSQSWGHTVVPFTNSPFWSLSYECLYYVAYALFYFLRGWPRVLSLAAWACIAGPQILFLLPVWCLGCCIYDLYQGLRASRIAPALRRVAGLTFLVAWVARRPILSIFASFNHLRNPIWLLHMDPCRATLLALGTGIAASLALLLSLLLVEAMRLERGNRWAHRLRHIAEGTFAIYLMHCPLMVFAAVIGLLRLNAPLTNIATASSICILLILIARPLNLFKAALRSRLQSLAHRVQLSPPNPQLLPPNL